jgi:hypothetical protein
MSLLVIIGTAVMLKLILVGTYVGSTVPKLVDAQAGGGATAPGFNPLLASLDAPAAGDPFGLPTAGLFALLTPAGVSVLPALI